MRNVPSAMRPFRLPGSLQDAVDATLERAIAEEWAERIWARDVSVWTDDEAVGERIADRLGWLEAPVTFSERADELEAFAAGVGIEGFASAVVLGMGGSSLAPETLARSFGLGEEGIPVAILDSTDPAAVSAIRDRWDPARTLYLVATKSGTTTETLSFLRYFWEVEDGLHGKIPDSFPGEHFAAITDPGRSLESIPHQEALRSVFLNPPDIGGRYSALSYVGLVPAALMDLDMWTMLGHAAEMAAHTHQSISENPGLALGVALGQLAREGRDKLTFLLEPSIAAFGDWVEQLIAESTGKRGVGIVPIVAEPAWDAARYGADRTFVRVAPEEAHDWRAATDPFLDGLAELGHPVIDIESEASGGLGGEFFRWAFATAVAGAVLGIDPFDEPNVTESKENTNRVLERFRDDGRLPVQEPLVEEGPLTLYGDAALRLTGAHADIRAELERHLARLRPNGYVAIQAYIAPTPERDAALGRIRSSLREQTRRATTLGYGPRYLHSTGQLHKGGPPSGCFLQLTAGHPDDLPIPGRKETFGVLIDAQALGDFESLEAHDLPILRIHLSDDPEVGLAALEAALGDAG